MLYQVDMAIDTQTHKQKENNMSNTTRTDSSFDMRLITKSTSQLSEGSNLYYTQPRVDLVINLISKEESVLCCV